MLLAPRNLSRKANQGLRVTNLISGSSGDSGELKQNLGKQDSACPPSTFPQIWIAMRATHIPIILILIFGCCRSLTQSKESFQSSCTVAGRTDEGELAIVCREAASGMCYRLSGAGANDTHQFPPGTAVVIDSENIGVRVSGSDGYSVGGLVIKKMIFLNSRQWPWFGPVSDMVCRAGKE